MAQFSLSVAKFPSAAAGNLGMTVLYSSPHDPIPLPYEGVSKNSGYSVFEFLKIRILLLRVLYLGPLFSETPTKNQAVVSLEIPYSKPNRPL